MLRYWTAGESHGPALVALVDGFPAGLTVDTAALDHELVRRQGGYGRGGRQRIETDTVTFLSGMWRGTTLGSPLALEVINKDAKLERLEDVSGTLEELWVSYNAISSLDGLSSCQKLTTLYIGNNRIADWAEVEKLAALESLRDVLLVGNPIEASSGDNATYRANAITRVPQMTKLDNIMITPAEREAASKL